MKTKLMYFSLILCFLACNAQEVTPIEKIVSEQINKEYNSLTTKKYLYYKKINKIEVINVYKNGFQNSSQIPDRDSSLWIFNLTELDGVDLKSEKNNWSETITPELTLLNDVKVLDQGIAKEINNSSAVIFHFSDIIYSTDKKKSLLGVRILKGLNISEFYVLVLSKKNEEWIQLNKIYSTEIN